MYVDFKSPEARDVVVKSRWTGQEIPRVVWVNTDMRVCEIYVHDSEGNLIVNDKKPLTAIVKGDFVVVKKGGPEGDGESKTD